MPTVKKRLSRGLEQLREVLDHRSGGDRATWMSAVTALVAPVESGVVTSGLVIGGMAMGTMTKVFAAVLVAAICMYFVTRTPGPESPRVALVESGVDEGGLGGVGAGSAIGDPATGAAQRSPVAGEAPVDESAAQGTNVLRVIFEGITEEYAEAATVTITGVKVSNGRRAKIQDTWPSRGLTSEFDLDPILARLTQGRGVLRDDELVVVVDHPLHFSETTRVALASGAELRNGQTLYEVPVRFSEMVYWPELTLAVRDANTRAHLQDVELRAVPTAYMGLVQQPGASDPFTMIGGGLSSPIVIRGGRKSGEPEDWAAGLALEPAAGEALRPAELVQPEEVARGIMVYARAAGYAWGRLVIDVSKGATRELLLEPATALSVRLANVQLENYAALGKRATLFVRRTRADGDETTVWSAELDETLETELLKIEALEAGDYAVLVELSESWQRIPLELGRETISLPAGVARELLLVVPDPPDPPVPANLAGTVSFPNFGGEASVRLEIYRSDYRYGDPDIELTMSELEPVDAALPTWSFRVEGLPADRYQIRLMPFLKSWMIDLPDGGREDVELVIPELAEVLVETIDARSDQRVPLEALAYRTLEVLPAQVTHGGSGPWHSGAFEGEPGQFRFWMAPGAAAVRTNGIPEDLDYGNRSEELELAPGLQSMRFELSPSCTLRVEFRVDGAALPHEDGIFTGLSRCFRPVGHDGRVGGMYPYSLFEASEPGIYEINFEGVGTDRFMPIPSQRVEVREGERAEVIVELQRR